MSPIIWMERGYECTVCDVSKPEVEMNDNGLWRDERISVSVVDLDCGCWRSNAERELEVDLVPWDWEDANGLDLRLYVCEGCLTGLVSKLWDEVSSSVISAEEDCEVTGSLGYFNEKVSELNSEAVVFCQKYCLILQKYIVYQYH